MDTVETLTSWIKGCDSCKYSYSIYTPNHTSIIGVWLYDAYSTCVAVAIQEMKTAHISTGVLQISMHDPLVTDTDEDTRDYLVAVYKLVNGEIISIEDHRQEVIDSILAKIHTRVNRILSTHMGV